MKHKLLFVAVGAAVSVLAMSAHAGSVAPGTYQIEDADKNGSGDDYLGHGVWLNNFITGPDTQGQGYQASEWSIVEGSAIVGADDLSFSATVENFWLEDQGYGTNTFELTMEGPLGAWEGADPGVPTCQNQAECDNLADGSLMHYYQQEGEYFAYLTGTSGIVDGMRLGLSVFDDGGTKPPQLGPWGGWFNENGDADGFATWLTWERIPSLEILTAQLVYDDCYLLRFSDDDCEEPGVGTNLRGNGDINWLLGDRVPGTVVPIPAAGWLLIGGLGALGALRRRRS